MLKVLKVIFCIFLYSLKINSSASAPTVAPAEGSIPSSQNSDDNKSCNNKIYKVLDTMSFRYQGFPLEIDNDICLEDISYSRDSHNNVLFLLKLDDSKNPFQNLMTSDGKKVADIFSVQNDNNDNKAPQKTSQVIDGCSVLVNDNFNYGEDYINGLIKVAIRLIREKEADHPENEEQRNFFYFFDSFSHGLDKNLDTKKLNSNSKEDIIQYFHSIDSANNHIEQYRNDQSNYAAEIIKLGANIKEKNDKITELKENIQTLDNYDLQINNADSFFKKAWEKIKLFFFKIKLWFKYKKYERNAIYVLYRNSSTRHKSQDKEERDN